MVTTKLRGVLVGLGFSCVVCAADLPVPCGGGNCGAGNPEVFVTSGDALYTVGGNVGTVEQLTDRVILNWSEFNVADGARVVFRQPRDISVALNRIFQKQSPSEILGAIDANGQVYLINPNGFVFGENARVNTNTLLASALNITDQVFNETGLINALNVENGIAALTAFTGADGEILIERGAELTTDDGGQILLFAPKIRNAGTIRTPGGQTILGAASQQVYLQFAVDTDIRGLLVEVRGGGSVENLGEIVAERGNITLAGILLQQQGVLRATTDIDENGSIRLLARDGVSIERTSTGNRILPQSSGTLLMGPGSITEILPVGGDETAIDAQPRAVSRVELMGKEIRLERGAAIRAAGGQVRITATQFPADPIVDATPNDSSLALGADVVIDVSGTQTTVLPMSRNQVDIELRSNELADSPLQRDGLVRGKKVSIDVRTGSSFANVEDAIANLGRSVDERLASGGDIVLESEGSVDVDASAVLDVSGGRVTFERGFVNSTQVLSGGEVIDISAADASRPVEGIFSGATRRHDAWGVTETFTDVTGTANARYEDGYVEGKDAGSVTLRANALDFAGRIEGGVDIGRNQRLPTTALDGAIGVGRPFDQVPDGARLTVDTTQGLAAVDVAVGSSERADVHLPAALLSQTAARSLRVLTLGAFDVGSDVDMVLPGGYSLNVEAGEIEFDGSFLSPGGELQLSASALKNLDAGNIRFGNGARVDVAGRWINDFVAQRAATRDSVWIDGGRIEVAADGDLIMDFSSVLNVNAGAWLMEDGTLSDGRGGAIALRGGLTAGRESRFIPTLGVSGFALHHGGSLTLEANALALQQLDAPIPSIGPVAGEGDFPILDPFEDLDFIPKVDAFIPSFLLRTNGFEDLTIAANRYGVVVAKGSVIRPRQLNYELPDSFQDQASDRYLSQFARVRLLPDYARAPANLTLSYSSSLGGAFLPESGVVMMPGSRIEVGPGGAIELQSTGSVWVDQATLRAPGGSVGLRIEAPDDASGFNASQSVRVASGSVVDVHGAFVAKPTPFGLREGTLLNGGDIVIDAKHGFVISEPGARYDVGGTAALLDITRSDPTLFEPTWLASNAGRMSIRTSEGGMIGGIFNALNDRQGLASGGRGGLFELAIDANDRKIPEENFSAPPATRFSSSERILAVVDGIDRPTFGYGDPIPTTLHSRAEFAPHDLDAAGFDSLVLRAVNVLPFAGKTVASDARIIVEADTDLQMGRRVELHAPIVDAKGAVSVTFAAPYVVLGFDGELPEILSTPVAGAGRLTLDAGFLDLVGRTRLSGFERIDLLSQSDIRLRGALADPIIARDLIGELITPADVTLSASRIYPTTLSQYRLELSGADSSLFFRTVDVASGDVFSYGGAVSFAAANISGVPHLYAPGGRIALEASDSIDVGDGALMSTRIEDLVLFGQTQGALDWIYPMPNGTVQLFNALEAPRISLSAPTLRLGEDASIDASGGADLLAYEFIAGPGGSRDVLARGNAGSMFAILPTRKLALAPLDEFESRQFLYGADTGVVLAGDASLPRGEFVVLPARYALLPGAFLVTPIDGLVDLVPGETRVDVDGSPIIAGRFTAFDTEIADARWQGFKVQPGSVSQLYSEYDLSRANTYFSQRGTSGYVPRDSGGILLDASGTIDLEGSVVARGDQGGRDGRLDLRAPSIALIGSADAAVAGVTNLIDRQLNQLEVGSLLIGARSHQVNGVNTLEVGASTISVGADVSLAQREIVLAARDRVDVGEGARIGSLDVGSGPASTSMLVDRGDAIVVVSKDRVVIERSGGEASGGGEGKVTLSAGSTLAAVAHGEGTETSKAGGTIAIQGAGGVALDGAIFVEAGRFDLYSNRLVFENEAHGAAGSTSVSQAAIAATRADELVLGAGDEMQFVDDVSLAAERIEFDAPRIRANGAAEVSVAAGDVVLGSSAAHSSAATAENSGTFTVMASTLSFGSGTTQFDGFASTRLTASDRAVARGVGDLAAAGDVVIDTPLIVAESAGAAFSASAAGTMLIKNSAPGTANLADLRGLPGGSLAFSGRTVAVSTAVSAPSGSISLSASGNDAAVAVRAGGVLDVAGGVVEGVVESIEMPGGRIFIQSTGDVVTEAGARLDVSGPLRAGVVAVEAPGGTVSMAGQLVGGADGRISVDARRIGDVESLVTAANGDRGFLGEQAYRQRRGDLLFGAGTRVETAHFLASADAGATAFDGELALLNGGRARMTAANSVAFGGTISGVEAALELEALSDGAAFAFTPHAATAFGGRVVARIRDSGTLEGRAIATDLEGVQESVELVTRLDVADGRFDSADATALRALLAGRAAVEAQSRAELGLGNGVELNYGVWAAAPGNLVFATPLDLASWRFGATPGRFLATAGGDVRVNASVSDAFRTSTVFAANTLQPDASWSLAMVAGADPEAADPLAVVAGHGSLFLAPNTTIRTGSGDITLRSGQNFVLGDATATVYTAGRRIEIDGFEDRFQFFLLHDVQFPDRGGDVDVAVLGDIVGAQSGQLISEYMTRFGGPFLDATTMPTMYGVAFQGFQGGRAFPAFRQGIGSFGGGDIRIQSRGSITDLSVVAPELFRHTGDALGTQDGPRPVVTFTDNSFERMYSDQVSIDAGGDIVGGVFYIGGGSGRVAAGGRIRPRADGLGLVLAQSSSAVELWADDDLYLETSFDPTLLTQSIGRLPRLQRSSEITYYSSYTPNTKLSVGSLTGDVVLSLDSDRLAEGFDSPGDIERSKTPFNVLPGTLRAAAATGNVSIRNDPTLFPSANGSLSIAAYGSVTGSDVPNVLMLSDADVNLIPHPDNPQQNLDEVERRLQFAGARVDDLHAAVPVHAHDPQPSTVEAITGSVDAPGLTLHTAEALTVVAGGEVNLFRIQSQHTKQSDVTRVQASGDVRILASRDPQTGRVIVNTRAIEVAGPGKLEVLAGHSIDLGTSNGIATIGDLENPVLADRGADVLLLSGNAGPPDFVGFMTITLTASPDALESFGTLVGLTFASADQALAFFEGLSEVDQRTAAFSVLFCELEAAGLQAATLIAQRAPKADLDVAYERGQRASTSLFPDTRDFSGDVGLYFSRIQTLDGGDIDVLVPGGELNVGLAVAFGGGKDASELGIVTQGPGDINVYSNGSVKVNRSRVFSLNGGDINIWSSKGDIDAGRGAKTTLATPALSASVGENDTTLKIVPPDVSGSGIAADDGTSGRLPDILLSTPNGLVDAGDAGIRTPGRLFTAATDVIGRDNIEVGSFVGAPAETVVLSSDLAGVGDTAASAAESIAEAAASQSAAAQDVSESQSALGWLDVFLEGYGEEADACDPKDLDCRKRG